jgi:hypothetical protein
LLYTTGRLTRPLRTDGWLGRAINKDQDAPNDKELHAQASPLVQGVAGAQQTA